jgi:hypothetical protein
MVRVMIEEAIGILSAPTIREVDGFLRLSP